MDENNNPQPPVTPAPIYQESQDKNAKWLWLLIFLIIIGAVVFAFFRGIGPFAAISPFVSKASPSPSESPFAESSPSVVDSSPSPSASPATKVNRSSVKVRVLNGSGTTGKAASVKDLLEGLGWKVASIGNADNSDYANTEVRVKASAKDYLDTMVADLSDKYSASAASKSLDASASADIEVVVGAK